MPKLLSLFTVLFFTVSSCQTPPPLRNVAPTTIVPLSIEPSVSIDKIMEEANFLPEQIGYVVYDSKTGKIVSALNENSAFIPASVSKVSNALIALETLGPTHRFQTEIRFRGKKKNKVWQGDLYLKGQGDPFLLVSDVATLATALEEKGLRKLEGHFYYDDSALPATSEINAQQPLDSPYNSGISALSLEFNRVPVIWHKAAANNSGIAPFSVPQLPWIHFQMGTHLAEKSESFFSWVKTGLNETWAFPVDASFSGNKEIPIKQPSRFTATVFQKLCSLKGVLLPPPEPAYDPAQGERVAVHESLPVVELADKSLEWSNNLMAELLLLSAYQKAGFGQKISLASAADWARKFWRAKIPLQDWSNYQTENGSGLSSAARATPAQLLALLKFGAAKKYGNRALPSLLPIAGFKGTLQDRLQTPDAALRVWAKTGTINYSSALLGTFYSKTDRPFLFSLLITDFSRRAAFDEKKSTPGTANLWSAQAKKFQDSLLRKWIEEY